MFKKRNLRHATITTTGSLSKNILDWYNDKEDVHDFLISRSSMIPTQTLIARLIDVPQWDVHTFGKWEDGICESYK